MEVALGREERETDGTGIGGGCLEKGTWRDRWDRNRCRLV